jgi:DNA-binding NarL/FixJ family response regulator
MDSAIPIFKKIWLADDDEDDCELFEDALKQILPAVSLITIPTADLLMTMLSSSNKPDILFLDINMPGKNGIDALVEIRAHRHFSRLPIVMFSSTKEPKFIHTSYGYGANLFYSKPTSFNELIAGLSNLFKMDWSDPFTITSNHYINNMFVAYDTSSFN